MTGCNVVCIKDSGFTTGTLVFSRIKLEWNVLEYVAQERDASHVQKCILEELEGCCVPSAHHPWETYHHLCRFPCQKISSILWWCCQQHMKLSHARLIFCQNVCISLLSLGFIYRCNIKSRLKDQIGKNKAGWVWFEGYLVTLLLKKLRQRCVSIFALLMWFHLDVVLCEESPV